jgi:hypothetical protein
MAYFKILLFEALGGGGGNPRDTQAPGQRKNRVPSEYMSAVLQPKLNCFFNEKKSVL